MLFLALVVAGIFGLLFYYGIIFWDGSQLQSTDNFDRLGALLEIKNQIDNLVESLSQLG